MRQPKAAAPGVRILADGMIEGACAAGPPPAGLGLLLDGTLHDVVKPQAAGRGWRFRHPLPAHLLFAELDLVTVPGGESVLGAPLGLAAIYALKMGPLTRAGEVIEGWFTAAPFLAASLGIGWYEDGRMIGQAVARRDEAGGRWIFSVTLRELARPGATRVLLPRVGGLALRAPRLTIEPDAAAPIGCLDSATPFHAAGWAIDPAAPNVKVALDILVNGVVVGHGLADRARADLAGIAGTDGACGFAVDLPPPADPAARQLVSVRLAGTRRELSGSPILIDPTPSLVGFFDSLHGMAARGWALNHEEPDVALVIEIVAPDGSVIGSGRADLFRGDLLEAGLNDGNCAFLVDIAAHFDRLLGQELTARIAGSGQILPGSPLRVSINPNIRRLLRRRQDARPPSLARLRRALNHRAGGAGISFIMPVHNPPRLWLIEALESVRGQFCDAWELICVDDGSSLPHVAEILRGYAARDARVRVLRSAENVGIARAVNFGLRAARFAHVAFLDHDDRLEPDAAWQLLRAARLSGADLLYSDEAQTAANIDAITELRLRPAFSHDYYLSHPYFVHLICVRTELARRIGGWDESMTISADVDFVLRMIEAANAVAHVPAVLYRWRTHGASAGHAKQSQVMAATMGALQRHLDRLGTGARVGAGVWFNQFRIDWPASQGKILIVIPTRNKGDLLRTAIDSIERTARGEDYRIVVIDHESDEAASRAYLRRLARRHVVMKYQGAFNFSRMNNQAVARHGGDCEFVLFLNNDVEATQDGWLDRLRRLANRAEVGAVGALLMYADQTVQHAGVILGFNQSAEHAQKFQPVFLNKEGRRNLGYNCALTATRDYLAVTAACLMTRRAVFEQVGGFDERFAIGFNDTDLCLRIAAAGYRNLYDGSTILYHYESATRSETKQVFHPEDTQLMIDRWGALLRGGDPFYNPNLSLTTQDHVPREDRGARVVGVPRVTKKKEGLLF